MNMYLFNENTTAGFHNTALQYLTIAAILCGIFVIISKNPIVSVLFLIGLFLSIAIYLMLLGINFIGLSYLLVYVGAVSILFLFILMLINIRVSEITSSTSNSIPLAIFIGTVFFSAVYQALPLAFKGVNPLPYADIYSFDSGHKNAQNAMLSGFTLIKQEIKKVFSITQEALPLNNILFSSNNTNGYGASGVYSNQNIELITSQTWDSMLAEASHINTLGNILYTSFPLWILLTSLILLLAMVGAIVITIKK